MRSVIFNFIRNILKILNDTNFDIDSYTAKTTKADHIFVRMAHEKKFRKKTKIFK